MSGGTVIEVIWTKVFEIFSYVSMEGGGFWKASESVTVLVVLEFNYYQSQALISTSLVSF